jgi:hypothetical protein
MATQTLVCPECDAPVLHGRLSCNACGWLLASVAGAPREGRGRAEITGATMPVTLDGGHPPEPGDPSADEVEPVAAPGDLDDASEPAPPEVELPDDANDSPGSTRAPAWRGASPPRPEPSAGRPTWPPVLPGMDGGPALHPSHAIGPASTPPAGAWLPPDPDAVARTSTRVPGTRPVPRTTGVSTPPAAVPAADPDAASPVAGLRLDRPSDLAGWLVTAGSSVGVVAFVLPWSKAIPFTAGFGYTDRWGLATPSHLLIALATLVTLALAVAQTPVPAWVRTGILPLALGGLLLGVVWPYVVGGFGSDVGSLGVALAGTLLVLGGATAVHAGRHGASKPAV